MNYKKPEELISESVTYGMKIGFIVSLIVILPLFFIFISFNFFGLSPGFCAILLVIIVMCILFLTSYWHWSKICFCTNCGRVVDDGKLCKSCGAEFNKKSYKKKMGIILLFILIIMCSVLIVKYLFFEDTSGDNETSYILNRIWLLLIPIVGVVFAVLTVLQSKIHSILKEKHPNKYIELERPSKWIISNPKAGKYILFKKLETDIDPELKKYIILLRVFWVIFILFLTLLLIYVTYIFLVT